MQYVFGFIATLVAFSLLGSGSAKAAGEASQGITLDGMLYSDTSFTNPLLDTNATINVKIYNPALDCILYEEQHNPVNTTATAGRYTIKVGSITGAAQRTGDDPNNAMADVFQNVAAIPATNTGCGGYTPSSGDDRFLRVTVTPSSTGVPQTLVPDLRLTSVPNALVCESIQGISRTDLIGLINGTDASALHHHDGRYAQLTNSASMTMASQSSIGLGAYTSGQETTYTGTLGGADAGKMWWNSTTSKMMYWDGATAQEVGTGAGGVTTVFGRAGAVVAATSDYDAVQIDNTAAGNIAATNVQAAIDELDAEKLALAGGTMSGVIAMGTNKITGLGDGSAAQDAATINNVNSAITANNASYVAKAGDSMSGALTLETQNELRLADDAGGDYISFKAPAGMSANYDYTLPANYGTNTHVLTTDGAGALTWTAKTSNTDTQNTLDQAYDEGGAGAGRAVTVDTGAIQFTGSNAADETLEITQSGNGGAMLIENTGTGASFRVNDEASDTTPFIVDAAGNVGVGTASPGYQLDVEGTGAASTIFSQNNTATGYSSVASGYSSSKAIYMDFFGASYSGAAGSVFEADYGALTAGTTASGLNLAAASASGTIKLYTGGIAAANERMRIDAAGNVGIGISNPAGDLHIRDAAAPANMYVQSDADRADIYLRRPAGFYGFQFFQTGTTHRFAVGLSNAAESGSNAGSNFQIANYDDAGAYLSTPLQIVRSTGFVGINATPTAQLDINGHIRIRANALPGTPQIGDIAIDSGDSNKLKYYDGAWREIATGTGSGSLDDAYNNGVAVTVDAGAIQFTGSNAADETLEVTQSGNGGAMLVENTGTGASFRVNDAAADSTPFVVDALGNVGIGTDSPISSSGNHSLTIQSSAPNVIVEDTDVAVGTDGRMFRMENKDGRLDFISSQRSGNNTAGSINLVSIDTAGNMGIGTVSPNYNLDVVDATGSSVLNVSATASGQTSGIEVGVDGTGNRFAHLDLVGDDTYTDYSFRVIRQNTGANAKTELAHRGTGDYEFVAYEAADMTFRTSTTTRMTILGSGEIGIGTATPTQKLHVNSGTTNVAALFENTDATAKIRVADTSGSAYVSTTGGTAYFGASSIDSNNIAVLSSGNVGIGAITPSSKLHVSGGELTLNGTGAYFNYQPNNTECANNEVLKWDDTNDRWICGTDNAGGGAGTLDASYDVGGAGAGRTITADTGAVLINGSNAADEALEVTQSGNGGAMLVENTGTGASFRVNDEAADTTPFVVDADGNVGAGTAAPNVPFDLHMSAATGTHKPYAKFGYEVSDPHLELQRWSGTATNYRAARAIVNASGDLTFSTSDNTTIGAQTFTERLHITNSGNVGIGTTSPLHALHVSRSLAGNIGLLIENDDAGGSAQVRLETESNSEGWHITSDSSGHLRFWDVANSANQVAITKGGSVGIGAVTPNASALLDVSSTTKGFLPPRMTTAQRDAIGTPADGLTIYNSDTDQLNIRANGVWTEISGDDLSYVHVRASGNQNNISTNTDFNFNTLVDTKGTNVSVNLSNDRITLKAGRSYYLRARAVVANTSPANSWFMMQWYDHTNTTFIGSNGSSNSLNTNTTGQSGQDIVAIVSPSTDIEVSARFGAMSASGTIDVSYINATAFQLGGSGGSGGGGGADHLGNHTATQNIVLGANYISGDGGAEGLLVDGTGNATFSNNVTLGNSAELRISDDAGGDYVSFKAPTGMSANVDYTLPPDDGNANEVLQTDGAGVLTWVAQSGGAPTSRDLIAGTGMTGGGDLTADRTFNVIGGDGIVANADDIAVDFTADKGLHFVTNKLEVEAGVGISLDANGVNVDVNGLTAEATPDGAADTVMIYDDSASALRKMTINNLTSLVGGNQTLDQVYDQGGNNVTVDAGAIQLTGSNAADETLEVTNSGNGGALLVENAGTGISFRVNDEASDTTPFVVNADGNVGIGTTTPAVDLHLSNATSFRPQIVVENTNNDANGGYLILDKAPTDDTLANGDSLGTVLFRGEDTSGTIFNSSYIASVVTAQNASSVDSKLRFHTTDGGTTAVAMILRGQSAAIGGGDPHASALLDVNSTTKGFLPPRMTTAQRTGISSPAEGLIVYDTDQDSLYAYQSGAWKKFSDGTPIAARAYGSGQSLSNNVWTLLNLNTETFDTDNIHDNVTNNSRMTIPVGGAGYYLINTRFAIAQTGDETARWSAIRINGADVRTCNRMADANQQGGTVVNCTMIANLADGDYVEMRGFQSSGGALSTQGATLEMVRIHDTASGGGGSDNLGNHTASSNIILGSHYLSGDGDNEGIQIDASGNVSLAQNLTLTGNVDMSGATIADNSIALDDLDFGSSANGLNIPSLASAPTGSTAGQLYFDTTEKKLFVYDGVSTWNEVGNGVGATTGFTAYESKALTTVHTATTAGIVVAHALQTSSVSHCYLDGYVDGTRVIRDGNRDGFNNSTSGSITFPVPKGSTYQVRDASNTCNTEVVNFVPLNAVSTITAYEDADSDTKIQVEESTDEDIIRFDTAGTERMVIDNSGNIGIGTSTPTSKLNVHDGSISIDADGTGGNITILSRDATTVTPAFNTQTQRSGGAHLQATDFMGLMTFRNATYTGSARIAAIASENHSGTASGGHLALSTTPNTTTTMTERMRITSEGNVGVGTVNPRTEYGAGMGTSPLYMTLSSDGATQASPSILGLSNPVASPDNTATAGSIQALLAGQGSTPNSRRIGIIGFGADGSTAGAYGGYIHFAVKADNDNVSGPAEAMRIVQSGNVGIGTATPTESKLQIAGDYNANFPSPDDDGQLLITGATNENKRLQLGFDTTDDYAYIRAAEQGVSIRPLALQPNQGNVGVGTTNPTHKLTVGGGAIAMDNNTGLVMKTSSGAQRLFFNVDGSDQLRIGNTGAGDGNDSISFQVTGIADALTIASSGNVGINTLTPASRLDVVGNYMQQITYGNSGNISITRANGTEASPTQVLSGERIGGLYFKSYHSGGGYSNVSAVEAHAAENHTNTGRGSHLSFGTMAIGATVRTTRMRITEAGDVGIGTTAPDQKLSVNGNASKASGGTSWAVFSDARLKTVHGTYDRGLEEIRSLEPIFFSYDKDNPAGIEGHGEEIGFVAQAVQKVIPEAVQENKNGYLTINADPILWAMTNAIKELDNKCEMSKDQLDHIQDQITAHDRRIATLEENDNAKDERIQKLEQENQMLKSYLCAKDPEAPFCQ